MDSTNSIKPDGTTPDDSDREFAASAETISCVVCREDIRLGAKKCIHCDSFQDWKRGLNFSSSVLALLVALVSVLGVTVPVIKDSFIKKNSKVVFAFGKAQYQSIFVIATNSGTRPGALGSAQLEIRSTKNGEVRKLKLFNFAQTGRTVTEFIAPGESKQFQLVAPRQLELPQRFIANDLDVLNLQAPYTCVIQVDGVQFDGSTQHFTFTRDCQELSKLIAFAAASSNTL